MGINSRGKPWLPDGGLRQYSGMTVAAQHYMIGGSACETLGRLRLGIAP